MTSPSRLCLALLLAATPAAAAPPAVEFNRDVRPILSDACFTCHGPDKAKRKADLRLDTEGGAKAFAGGLAKSAAWHRISSTDENERMPPAKAARQLTAAEKATLKRWVEQGAKYQKHWAFIAPSRPAPPDPSDRAWPRNPLDAFVLARLQKEGLKPAAEADRVTLIRRLSLDLTGLPPTPGEVDAFLDDPRPEAYERLVDRLLGSARFGERLAVRWLDAARYADTNGYQNDGERTMWRWRDWVIEAYNQNLPFDRFTIEQLAGDLLEKPTLEQLIATGFNRNHRGNAEGGIIPEEYAVEYVADRAETTATVWLGLTAMCSRCHDHKYDALTMRDFYGLFAFFNNVPERGKAVKYGNSPPLLLSPTRLQQEQLAGLDARLARAEAAVKALRQRLDDEQARWEKSLKPGVKLPPVAEQGLTARFALDGDAGEARFVGGKPAFDGKAADLDGKRHLEAAAAGKLGFYDRFSLSAWVKPRSLDGTIVSRMADEPGGEGYAVVLRGGRVGVHLTKRWLDDALRVETEAPLKRDAWQHVLVTYDGSRWADGVKVYLDGKPSKLRVELDELNQTFETKHPFRIGAGHGPKGRFNGLVSDVRVYSRELSAGQALALAVPQDESAILAVPAAKRTPGQARKLRAYYLVRAASKEVQDAYRARHELREARRRLIDSVPTTMVMKEMPTPRQAHVLLRGEYNRPGEKVAPAVPAALPPLAKGEKADRLALARWLVDERNPLTARVTVNRFWQMLFGVGLVKTSEDFGVQGEWPSHPELLDWLAVEFRESGWDVKRLLRLIVTSATYRQSSALTPELLKRDPENRLLARGPRLRLPAEMIRDQALAASGLLVERLGGPSVKPYQPEGLWNELADVAYVQDTGEDLYRRGMYTYWKRTVAPPGATTFDASGRESCNVREARTNTPLQALNLLNDVTYVEAARVLASRAMRGAKGEKDRLTLLFRLVLTRRPSANELGVLRSALARHRAHYEKDRTAAAELIRAGEAPTDRSLDVAEQAAYAAVAAVVLNLDEAVTKE